MISHALTIITNELRRHLADAYAVPEPASDVVMGNIADSGGAGVSRDMLAVSIVNIREEKALKNLPSYVGNEIASSASYQNPQLFLNVMCLVVATHTVYADALLMLSRAVRFFHAQPVFRQDTVAPVSITSHAPGNVRDRVDEFELVFELNSPSMEEVNHLWGTLGGRQYPFALYSVRMMLSGVQPRRT